MALEDGSCINATSVARVGKTISGGSAMSGLDD